MPRNFLSQTLALVLILALGVILVGPTSPAIAKKKEVIERFEAHASSLSAGRATLMQIGIYGWNTQEERQELIKSFDSGGTTAAYNHLNKMDEMAFVKAPNTMGYQMRYAFQYEQDGKQNIILATDRPIATSEIMQDSWTKDDNISLVVLQLDPETGEGTGEMIVGAGFGVNKKTGQFEIESMASNPIKFSSVKKMEPKHKKN